MISLQKKPGLFCISFDSVSMSGIIVELLKIAKQFYANEYLIYVDLGYEIKFDKKNFFVTYSSEKSLFPDWVDLIKVIKKPFYDYSERFVAKVFEKVIHDSKLLKQDEEIIQNYADYITHKLLKLWHKLNIKAVLVENGTLPENIIFTRALYKAIELYGHKNNLNKYVIWRDHDLMWSSEANINKYGNFPYPNTQPFLSSKYISHVVLHEEDHQQALRWVPNAALNILRNDFQINQVKEKNKIRAQFRESFNIPKDAFMLARYTRIIPQKRIDRDIHLMNILYKLTQSMDVYLLIAGNPDENRDEYLRLKKIIAEFELEKYVLFIGNIAPMSDAIENFIIASDLCCFMTSYHYDSFGNPIAEAISLGKPYITTSYKQYAHVYADRGYKGLVFPITENDDEQITEDYAKKVYDLLHNSSQINSITMHNIHVMKEQQSREANLATKLTKLLDIQFNELKL